jgi:hypothetical protein
MDGVGNSVTRALFENDSFFGATVPGRFGSDPQVFVNFICFTDEYHATIDRSESLENILAGVASFAFICINLDSIHSHLIPPNVSE